MKSKELLLKHLALNDCKGYVTSDGRLYKAIIDALEEAINHTHCCKSDSEQLKDLEILSFEEWQEQNQELIRKSIGITGNEMAIELDLYTKYKTDQLQNLLIVYTAL
jgi:hypothetical protein